MMSPAQAIVNAERTDGQINTTTTQMALLHDTPFVSSMFYNVTTLLCTHLVFYRLSSVLNRWPDKSALPHARAGKSTLRIQTRLPPLGSPVLPVLAYPDVRDESALHARTNKSALHEWTDKSAPPHAQTDKSKLHIQT